MLRQLLRFGDCTLDIAARELRRAGERVELPPTVFDCMTYLVEHRDRAVGRDELVAAVWGKTSISDTMLGKAVLAIRRAVGDDAERQTVLRTVPRFGYHWVAPVVAAVAETPAASAPAAVATPAGIGDIAAVPAPWPGASPA
ncbi:winged helix-turn-helix domain-containing protein, partial [Tahibacter caeni]|uniref:winged helix-turn-helix domain-containing protein n=1 Tax=Tahibacter caeni TaxID=1453545 RepID=UPI00214812A3